MVKEVYPYVETYFKELYDENQGDYDECIKNIDKSKVKTLFQRWYSNFTRHKITFTKGIHTITFSK